MTDQLTRTISYTDPSVGARLATEMDGLEYLRAMQRGEVPAPPITALMNMGVESVEAGEVVFTATPDTSHYNPLGTVHGGFMCTVLDSVTGCAVQSTLPRGLGYTSLDLTVSYLRPLAADSGVVRAIGRVVKPGKRVAFAEARLEDSAGRLVATATSTLLVFPFEAPAA